jgi:HAMP domain-containing protein
MTDEERRELVAYLRNPGHDFRGDNALADEILVAADEIERLAEEVEEWKQAAEVEADEVTEVYDKIKGHAVTNEDRPLGFRTNDVPDPYAEGRGDFAKYAEQFNKELVWKLRSGAATFIEKMAADEIARLNDDVKALRQQIEHYHGRWGKRDD